MPGRRFQDNFQDNSYSYTPPSPMSDIPTLNMFPSSGSSSNPSSSSGAANSNRFSFNVDPSNALDLGMGDTGNSNSSYLNNNNNNGDNGTLSPSPLSSSRPRRAASSAISTVAAASGAQATTGGTRQRYGKHSASEVKRLKHNQDETKRRQRINKEFEKLGVMVDCDVPHRLPILKKVCLSDMGTHGHTRTRGNTHFLTLSHTYTQPRRTHTPAHTYSPHRPLRRSRS